MCLDSLVLLPSGFRSCCCILRASFIALFPSWRPLFIQGDCLCQSLATAIQYLLRNVLRKIWSSTAQPCQNLTKSLLTWHLLWSQIDCTITVACFSSVVNYWTFCLLYIFVGGWWSAFGFLPNTNSLNWPSKTSEQEPSPFLVVTHWSRAPPQMNEVLSLTPQFKLQRATSNFSLQIT